MNTINKHNCEAWFLDYFEGNLSPEQSEQLFRFLEENPQYQEVFNEYEKITLEPENLSFNVQTLFKDISVELANEMSGSDYVAIAYTENILNDTDKGQIANLIQQEKTFRDTVELYSQLKLKPNMAIVFEEKNKLKKPIVIPFVRIRVAYKYIVSAAAVVLFALTLWNYLPQKANKNIIGLAVPSKRPIMKFKSKDHSKEIFKMPTNAQKVKNLTINQNYFQNKNVQTSKYLEKIENKELEIAENINKEILKEQNIEETGIENIIEKPIKSINIPDNNVKTLNEEKYVKPENLILSKLLKKDPKVLINNEYSKKSNFWNTLDIVSRIYSNVTERKVKIKKFDKEDNTTVFALITDKFEISYTGSKK